MKNPEEYVQSFDEKFLEVMYKDDGYSEERAELKEWLLTSLQEYGKACEEKGYGKCLDYYGFSIRPTL